MKNTNEKNKSTIQKEYFHSIDRTYKSEIVVKMQNYWERETRRKALLAVSGFPGTGKSHICMEIRNDPMLEDVCIVYADVSDCADEIDIYYKIAKDIQAYLDRCLDNGVKSEAIAQFLKIYEWIYGVKKQYVAGNTAANAESLINDIVSVMGKIHKEYSDTVQDKFKTAMDVIGIITKVFPYVSVVSDISKIVVDSVQKQHAKMLMQEVAEAFSSKADREIILRKLLIMGIEGDGKVKKQALNPVIILDNFQLETNNDLGRDQTWLSQPGRLMDSLDAMWIIVSRQSVSRQFRHIFSGENMLEEIVVHGFDEGQAREYFEKCCPCEETDDQEIINEHKAVLEQMLQAGRVSEHSPQQGDEQYSYLPYLLRLLVLHYRALERDPSHKITSEDFVALNSKEEIFGYYFYKDLTDLMINAFQILSCIPTWDSFWIEVVRRKFDNHLLNARNLLFNTAPMEEDLKKGSFKIHEAVKDSLYNSSRNYIKQDVLKYLFDLFHEVYGTEEASKNKEVWYQPEHLETFVKVVFIYIQEDTNEETIDSIRSVMGEIYEANKSRGDVSDSFIRLYNQYIDKVREAKNIPYIALEHIDLRNMEALKNQITDQVNAWNAVMPDFQSICDYMQSCFNLGDLYTNNSQSEKAVQLEKLYLHFWEKMLEKIEQVNPGSEEYFQCYQKKVKALNAVAYDSSAEHEYQAANEYGERGIEECQILAPKLLERLRQDEKITDEDMQIYQVIIRPEDTPEFTIDSCTEMSRELYAKLVVAYRKLLEPEIQQHFCGKILSGLLLFDQQNLRGNYPWYQLKTRIKEEIWNENSIWKYGARTYWLRKARLQAAEEVKADEKKIKDYRLKMQDSYHNVCVYLYKIGKVETACILENEVIEQSRQLLPCKTLSLEAQERLKNARDSDPKGERKNILLSYLWKKTLMQWEKESSPEKAVLEFFQTNAALYEQIQYLGDYYLHMGFYEIAVKQLVLVMLYRMVVQGEKDSKTLDTLIRLFVAVYYANGSSELLQIMNDYVEGKECYKLWEGLDTISKGVKDKLDCLMQVYELSKEADMPRKQKVQRMLEIIDMT